MQNNENWKSAKQCRSDNIEYMFVKLGYTENIDMGLVGLLNMSTAETEI